MAEKVKLFKNLFSIFWWSAIPIRFESFYYHFYWIPIWIFLTFGIYLEFALLLRSYEVMSEFTKNFCIFVGCAQSFIRTVDLVFRRQTVQNLINQLEMDDFYSENEDFKKITKHEIRNQNRTIYFLLTIAGTTSGFFLLTPYFESDKKFPMPHNLIIPFVDFTLNSWLHPIFYALTSIIYAYISIMFLANDLLVAGLLAHLGAKFEIFSLAVGRFFDDLKEKKDIHRKEIFRKIKIYTEHHKKLLEIAERLALTFNFSMSLQIWFSLLMICFTAYQANMIMGNHILETIYCLQYLNYCTIQLLIYCLNGQKVTTQSEMLSEKIYSSNWEDFLNNNEIRTFILLFLKRTQRPFSIKVGVFYTFNSETFMSVIKTSYSLFTLLVNMSLKK